VKTVDIIAASRNRAICRSCGARVEWAEVYASGKRMPFDQVVVIGEASVGGQAVQRVDLDRSHWATCPDAAKWRQGR
jgi:hypothetical protein